MPSSWRSNSRVRQVCYNLTNCPFFQHLEAVASHIYIANNKPEYIIFIVYPLLPCQWISSVYTFSVFASNSGQFLENAAIWLCWVLFSRCFHGILNMVWSPYIHASPFISLLIIFPINHGRNCFCIPSSWAPFDTVLLLYFYLNPLSTQVGSKQWPTDGTHSLFSTRNS